MSRYYCLFCSSRYQFHVTRSDGVLICSQCGDPLIKTSLLNSRRIMGVVGAIAFLAPLLAMIALVVRDFSEENLPNNSDLIARCFLDKSWKI